jgi:hypothetical protein
MDWVVVVMVVWRVVVRARDVWKCSGSAMNTGLSSRATLISLVGRGMLLFAFSD